MHKNKLTASKYATICC